MNTLRGMFSLGAAAIALCGQIAWGADAPDVRYVWANNLILRAQPDGKGAELAKLPFGTTVTIVAGSTSATVVPHQETLLKLTAGNNAPAAEVNLDGNWRRVSAGGTEGWVFDGYLSRYPVRHLSADRGKKDDESEADFAKRIFGTSKAYQWHSGEGKKSADYRAMLQHTKMNDKQTADNVTWEYAEFKVGGAYEMLGTQPDGGMYSSTIDFRNLPLSYGEALLWLKQFGGLNAIGGNGIGKFSGKVVAGKHLEIGPADDDSSGFGFARSVDCTATTCSFNYGFSD